MQRVKRTLPVAAEPPQRPIDSRIASRRGSARRRPGANCLEAMGRPCDVARVRRAPPSSTSASRRRRTASAGNTLFALLLQVCGDLPAGVSRSIRLADLLAQSEDDAFRPADVGKPIRVLVLHHFAYQLGPVGEQARDDSVDVFDGEHDATDAQRVHRRVHGPKPDRVGRVELVELDATVAVRGPHQREGGANILEPDQAVDRRSLDLRLAFELEAEFDEERLGRLEVIDNDENVVHALNRHVLTLLCDALSSNVSLRPTLVWSEAHGVAIERRRCVLAGATAGDDECPWFCWQLFHDLSIAGCRRGSNACGRTKAPFPGLSVMGRGGLEPPTSAVIHPPTLYNPARSPQS